MVRGVFSLHRDVFSHANRGKCSSLGFVGSLYEVSYWDQAATLEAEKLLVGTSVFPNLRRLFLLSVSHSLLL